MATTPGARFVVDWSRAGLVERAFRDEINQATTHVEAHFQASQDAGSIPAASTEPTCSESCKSAFFVDLWLFPALLVVLYLPFGQIDGHISVS